MILVVVEFLLQPNAQDKFESALLEMQSRIENYEGFLGEEPCRAVSDPDKFISLFRFSDHEAVEAWRNDEQHLRVQALGKSDILSWYRITVADVEREYEVTC